jgi:hypothetical protein
MTKIYLILFYVALILSIFRFGESFRPLSSRKLATFVDSSKRIGSIIIASGITFFGAPLAYDALINHGQSIPASNFIAIAAETSVFDGLYNDPNHPGCLRKITSKVNF